MVDDALLDAAVVALQTVGWDELTLEKVAGAAGVSRVTLWRQGVSREAIIEGLLARLTRSYREALWPILTLPGSGADRLRAALQALCRVADQHLPLLLASDTIFHQAQGDFNEPLKRLLYDGIQDGTIRQVEIAETASLLFNSVCWTYVHLRARHQWDAEHTQTALLDLVLQGVLPNTT